MSPLAIRKNTQNFLCLVGFCLALFACKNESSRKTQPGTQKPPNQVACEGATDSMGNPTWSAESSKCQCDTGYAWDSSSDSCATVTDPGTGGTQDLLQEAEDGASEEECQDSSRLIWSDANSQCYIASRIDSREMCHEARDLEWVSGECQATNSASTASASSFAGITKQTCNSLESRGEFVEWDSTAGRCVCPNQEGFEPHPTTYQCMEVSQIEADLAALGGSSACAAQGKMDHPLGKAECLTKEEYDTIVDSCETIDTATNSCTKKKSNNLLEKGVKFIFDTILK